ncbi:MAG: hypothetical protein WDN44_11360 [Sphingomonas sp.]
MQDPRTGVTLKAYLDSVADPAETLIFTGHSLGGALAPTLALLLYPAPPASPTANVARWANIFILPTAGPTPGTQAIADLFAAAYPPTDAPRCRRRRTRPARRARSSPRGT